ncbi:phage baseplate assembly protein V [Azospirillum sp.]|uniref:phage baseplate assembly protein V n=1 Tax=Azospirillum sp. TaxID=34012 RepID=UPI002D350562|nr:phage baseplate assembly protein V [Azospirillum sp.]HYD67004.1 phage baseplate assembly protein V [Azospirillum sp.]
MTPEFVDLERRVANVVHFATVEAADYAKARVRVRIGPNVTAWLPWAAARAGGDRSWHPPEVGEQVVLAAPCGDLNQAVVLGSVYQAKHAAPGDRATVSRTVWEDGAVLEYDRAAHAYTLDVPAAGTITLHLGAARVVLTNDGVALECGGSRLSVTPDAITLAAPAVGMSAGGGSGTATLAGNFRMQGQLAVTGDVSASGSVLDGGGNSNHHSH